jgi:hypothetical protein
VLADRNLDDILPAIDELLQKEKIRELIYSYCRAVDRFEFDRLADLYWPEAIDEHGFNDGTIPDFIRLLKEQWQAISANQHYVSNLYVKIDGDYAEAESYLYCWTITETAIGPVKRVSFGRYLDRFERRDGEWRFIKRRVTIDLSPSYEVTAAELGYPKHRNLPQGFPDERDPSWAEFRLFRRGER